MKKKKRRQKKFKYAIISLSILVIFAVVGIFAFRVMTKEKPEDLLKEYMAHIEKKEYEEMYSMIDTKSVKEEKFLERNSKIYEGMEVENLKITEIQVGKRKEKKFLFLIIQPLIHWQALWNLIIKLFLLIQRKVINYAGRTV